MRHPLVEMRVFAGRSCPVLSLIDSSPAQPPPDLITMSCLLSCLSLSMCDCEYPQCEPPVLWLWVGGRRRLTDERAKKRPVDGKWRGKGNNYLCPEMTDKWNSARPLSVSLSQLYHRHIYLDRYMVTALYRCGIVKRTFLGIL